MALRKDYYIECENEINRKINLVESIIEQIKPKNYNEEFGMENSTYSDSIEGEIRAILEVFQDIKDILGAQKGRLAHTGSEVGEE